ncbi:helix-turn-helix domain-containing protein [Paenibacillus qinlingensis]|uniref:AraC-like DNA-binding protein n=1 Tax=Paenibacillus qinlingensis TaxID=1837343 RepID=A0ABU1NUD7_9BACL|nr:helix-turn-helix domain-containing protein [Paenibacillus qinlingensis]MDR6551097.1 AraC-like DNA-binding protein [Paenibacillus qinlingensis]
MMNAFEKESTQGYIPLQPEMAWCNAGYQEYKTPGDAHHIPALFYQFRSKDVESPEFVAIPDGHVDMLFCCDASQPDIQVYGSVLSRHTILLKRNTDYFGVRFLSLHMTGKSNIEMKDLISHSCSLLDFIKISPRSIEPIYTAATFTEKIRFFQETLGEVLTIQQDSRLIRFALNQMIISKGNMSVKDLASETAYSERYLRKQFEHFVGLSPKVFGQITRFQHALNGLMTVPQASAIWETISEHADYYDQAHFINEFKKFYQETPHAWMKLHSSHLSNVFSFDVT